MAEGVRLTAAFVVTEKVARVSVATLAVLAPCPNEVAETNERVTVCRFAVAIAVAAPVAVTAWGLRAVVCREAIPVVETAPDAVTEKMARVEEVIA